jgi:NADH dehydrogenase FAD-containing subunit
MSKLKLVLCGGGHAHILALKQLFDSGELALFDVALISDYNEAYYSGQLPGAVCRQYARNDICIDLPALAKRFHIGFVHARVISIDTKKHLVQYQLSCEPSLSNSCEQIASSSNSYEPSHCKQNTSSMASNETIAMRYDRLSINIGSTIAGQSIEGVRRHAVCTRPINEFLDRLEIKERCLFDEHSKIRRVVVVGAGVAGIELAWTLDERYRCLTATNSVRVTLVNAGDKLLPDEGAWFRRNVDAAMRARRVDVVHRGRVVAVHEDRVTLSDGRAIGYDVLVWATGAAPRHLDCDTLPRDNRGFLRVRATLQCVGADDVFAVGDCASLGGHPTLAKAGVYAVREAPVLARNLVVSAGSASPLTTTMRRYEPQSSFLALLNAGDGTAVSRWHGISLHNSAMFALKDRIDRAFMSQFPTTSSS